MIKINHLTLIFNPRSALETRSLNDISLQIKEGEFVTIIGSNGAGKSSLLASIAGNWEIAPQTIFINEIDISTWPTHKRARLVSRVFQDPLIGACADLTIEENMALAASRGKKRGLELAITPKQRRLFQERLSILGLGLENRLNDETGKLSGGQRQALTLIMATLAPNQVLLLDEHTAALDPKMAEYVFNLTARIYSEYSPTIIMVTHSMKQALAFGNRTIMLHQGRIVLDIESEKRKLLTVPKLLNLFFELTHETIDDDRLLLDC